MNEDILLAPTTIQEEMKLVNTGWAFAASRGRTGLVPLNYVVLSGGSRSSEVPIPREGGARLKSSLKRVSFGENQVMHTDDVDRKLNEQAKLVREGAGGNDSNNNGDGS